MPACTGYLYVDDDPFSREAMRVIIEIGMKEHLTLLKDSTDFLQNLQGLRHCPKVILLDIHMTPYTGFELLQMLRADATYAGVPVVALTASVMNEEVSKLRTAGFDGAIAKPFSVTTLPALLQRIENGETVWNITES
jgi:CheY-like chemotaxis protein